MNVLGAISITNIITTVDSDKGSFCFRVSDNENDNWDLCSSDAPVKTEWTQKILSQLNGGKQASTAVVNFIEKDCDPQTNRKATHSYYPFTKSIL